MSNKYLEKVAKDFRGQYGHAVDVHGSMEDKHSKIYTPEIQAAQNRRSERLGKAESLKTKKVVGKAAGKIGLAVGAGAGLATMAMALKKKKSND
jgi:hypothetical protein